MAAQIGLGADIIMAFDECTEYPADPPATQASMELTLRWAERSKRYFEEHKHEVPWRGSGQCAVASGQQTGIPRCSARNDRLSEESTQSLFGIVQGGMDLALRKESAERTIEIGFPWLCHRRAQRWRTSGAHSRSRRSDARTSSRRQAALPNGSGYAGGDRRVRQPRRRYDGLRLAHAGRAPWPAVHFGGKNFHQAGALCPGCRSARSQMRSAGCASAIPGHICGIFMLPMKCWLKS